MKRKELSKQEIANKIREGNDFVVSTERERKHALTFADFIGADIFTRKHKGGFKIYIPSEVEN